MVFSIQLKEQCRNKVLENRFYKGMVNVNSNNMTVLFAHDI